MACSKVKRERDAEYQTIEGVDPLDAVAAAAQGSDTEGSEAEGSEGKQQLDEEHAKQGAVGMAPAKTEKGMVAVKAEVDGAYNAALIGVKQELPKIARAVATLQRAANTESCRRTAKAENFDDGSAEVPSPTGVVDAVASRKRTRKDPKEEPIEGSMADHLQALTEIASSLPSSSSAPPR